MSNILAISNKELRSYFASPIAYAVVGLFALVFGFMFYAFLRFFVHAEHAHGDGRHGRRRPTSTRC